jgi:hypothetical protein
MAGNLPILTTRLRKVWAQFVRRNTFDHLEHVDGGVPWPDSYEQADVVGLDCQFLDVPAVLGAHGFDQLPASLGDILYKDGLPPLGTPDQVVDDHMDPVFVSLIFHVDIGESIDIVDKCIDGKRRVDTLAGETRLTTATKLAWLAAGSVL